MLEPGTLVGRYQIERRLGRGGMGTLYLATDPVLSRPVALKLFLGDLDSSDYRERFSREARAVAALNHPNIVTIHDYGEFAAQPYIVMELIDGHTLADLCDTAASIPIDERLRWLEELCAGAAFVHREGIIHRDIKPSNAMIDRARRLKLLDFGIARMGSSPSASVTGPLGSPGYMAPEQINGGAIDPRADIFAIGAVSYELLTTVPAFGGAPFEQIHKILNVDPTPPAAIASDLPQELSEAIMRALAKNPASRFSDAESFGAVVSSIRRRLAAAGHIAAADVAPTVIVRRPRIGTPTHTPIGATSAPAATTPPPGAGTPRPGRETWTRRRAERIAGMLGDANASLERGQLDEARDACEQALTIDENHVAGLALYEKVKAALAHREALGFLADAQQEMARGDLAAAAGLAQRARALGLDTPEAARLERDLKLARVEAERTRKRREMVSAAIAASKSAFRRADPEAALLHAHEALDLEPDNAAARSLQESALQLLNGAVEPTAVVPMPVTPAGDPFQLLTDLDQTQAARPAPADRPVRHTTPAPKGAPPKPATIPKTQASPVLVKARQFGQSLVAALAPMLRHRHFPAAAGAAVAVIGGVAVIAWMASGTSVAPEGRVTIDAVPWATVTAVTGPDGKSVALPADASTPLTLDLPAGSYQVSLQGPAPGSEDRQLQMNVVTGETVVMPRLEFSAMTPEVYFEPYLASTDSGREQ